MTSLPRPRSHRGITRPSTEDAISTSVQKPLLAGVGGIEPVLYTPEQAAALLQVRPSWLRRKAAARAVPCRFVGKHLRFSHADINAIAEASATSPRQTRRTVTN
jgi:hypothetical protein